MADKTTFQKEIEAKLKELSKIINELRAEGEKKLKSGSEDLIDHCDKIQMLGNKYLEAREELKKLAKTDEATWEKHKANIQRIMDDLNHLWGTLF
jgi:DNA repair exonuclease SbcCD ATPase subunit